MNAIFTPKLRLKYPMRIPCVVIKEVDENRAEISVELAGKTAILIVGKETLTCPPDEI